MDSYVPHKQSILQKHRFLSSLFSNYPVNAVSRSPQLDNKSLRFQILKRRSAFRIFSSIFFQRHNSKLNAKKRLLLPQNHNKNFIIGIVI